MESRWQGMAGALREQLERIPREMYQDEAARQSIVCLLAEAVRQMGLLPLPGWRPPKSTRDRLDLVGVDASQEVPRVALAFVVDPLVELAKVRALEWVECPDKVVVTFSRRTDKVAQSTFFLKPELVHLDIFG